MAEIELMLENNLFSDFSVLFKIDSIEDDVATL
jgi:hypothetical protein